MLPSPRTKGSFGEGTSDLHQPWESFQIEDKQRFKSREGRENGPPPNVGTERQAEAKQKNNQENNFAFSLKFKEFKAQLHLVAVNSTSQREMFRLDLAFLSATGGLPKEPGIGRWAGFNIVIIILLF